MRAVFRICITINGAMQTRSATVAAAIDAHLRGVEGEGESRLGGAAPHQGSACDTCMYSIKYCRLEMSALLSAAMEATSAGGSSGGTEAATSEAEEAAEAAAAASVLSWWQPSAASGSSAAPRCRCQSPAAGAHSGARLQRQASGAEAANNDRCDCASTSSGRALASCEATRRIAHRRR